MTYWFSNRAALHWFKHPSRMSSVDGYVGSSAGSELVDLIDLHVLCVNGEGCSLSLSPSTLGLEVRTMVSEQLPTEERGKAGPLPPSFTIDAPANVARAGHWREDCELCPALIFQQTYTQLGDTSKDSKSLSHILRWMG